jgi:hypothetical protein
MSLLSDGVHIKGEVVSTVLTKKGSTLISVLAGADVEKVISKINGLSLRQSYEALVRPFVTDDGKVMWMEMDRQPVAAAPKK